MNRISPLTLLSLALVAIYLQTTAARFVKRRFNQEAPPILQQVKDLKKLTATNKGEFDTISGQFITTLIAAGAPCARYQYIDELVTVCKGKECEKEGIKLAASLASLEKNFNPFSGEKAKPLFCDDPSLPKSQEVRCVVPLIDPGFPGAQKFNEQATARLTQIQTSGGNSKLCEGKSVLQQAQELGISDCVGCKAGGTTPQPPPNASSSGNNSSGNTTPVTSSPSNNSSSSAPDKLSSNNGTSTAAPPVTSSSGNNSTSTLPNTSSDNKSSGNTPPITPLSGNNSTSGTPPPLSDSSASGGSSINPPNTPSAVNAEDCVEDTTPASNNTPPKNTPASSKVEEDCVEDTTPATKPKPSPASSKVDEDCVEDTAPATKPKPSPASSKVEEDCVEDTAPATKPKPSPASSLAEADCPEDIITGSEPPPKIKIKSKKSPPKKDPPIKGGDSPDDSTASVDAESDAASDNSTAKNSTVLKTGPNSITNSGFLVKSTFTGISLTFFALLAQF